MINTGRDTYMTVWSVTEKDGKYRGRTSTSRKNTKDNTYVNSNWTVIFVGKANEKAANLVERDKIVIKSGDLRIENIFLPETDGKPATNFVSVTVFDFEKADSNSSNSHSDELPV